MEIAYTVATADDLPRVRDLLSACGLSTQDIERCVGDCIVAKSQGQLVGAVAIETLGPVALFRSLAVSPAHRKQSVGRALCDKVVSHARLRGVERLYLLTTDADRYFSARGFTTIGREEVPPAIRGTAQFETVCPQSAVCMSRSLLGEVVHATRETLRLRPDVPGARMWAVSLERTMLTYFEVDPNCRFESHSHESEQITMVLTGELFFEARGRVHRVRAGEAIAIPSAVPHAVWTESQPVTAVDAWSPVMTKYDPQAEPGAAADGGA